MSCKFSSPQTVYLSELRSGISPAHSPGVQLYAILLKILSYGIRTADFLKHLRIPGSALHAKILCHQCDNQVRCHKPGLVIHEHDSVRIPVIYHSDVSLSFGHKIAKQLNVLRHQRIRLMIRETSVHRVEDIGRLVAEHLLGEQARSNAISRLE